MATYDVAIIGGGPAGLSCAIYTARAKHSTLILDRAPTAGALASSSKIANFPGVAGPVPGKQVLDTMRAQAVSFGAEYLKAQVSAVDFSGETKALYTIDSIYHSRTVVIATGAMGKQSVIEGEEEYLGRGIGYCATCDAPFFTDKVAAVVGSSEIAMEEAIFLARFAKEVHLISPNVHLCGPVELLEEIESSEKIIVHNGTYVRKIVGGEFVTGIVVRRGNDEFTIDAEGVFLLQTGRAPVTDFLGDSLKVSEDRCIIVDNEFSTNVPGVYAVGDVTCIYPKQAIIAAGEGAIAALAIDKYLSGRERVRADYM